MKVISLGWGVQSFTLAAMSALGELPKVDVAIHSDTTHERTETYKFAEKWSPWLEKHGLRVVTVRDMASATRVTEFIPARSIDAKGIRGMAHRQCTDRWKIRPMRRWLRGQYPNAQFEMWLGISVDEVERARPADVKYIVNVFPLLEKRLTREDCKRWLLANRLDVPVKSSCVFCPFHSRSSWRELKQTGNGDWERALETDELLRNARPPIELFLHNDYRPLREAGDAIDLQPELDLTGEECTGACFL